jgi:translocation and assembly module TamA
LFARVIKLRGLFAWQWLLMFGLGLLLQGLPAQSRAESSMAPLFFMVTGVAPAVADNVLAELNNHAKDWQKDLRGSVRQIKRKTQDALMPYGYFSSRTQISWAYFRDSTKVNVKIEPGFRCVIEQVTVKIKGDQQVRAQILAALKDHKIIVGQHIIPERYQHAKHAVVTQLRASGYAQATLLGSKVILDLADRRGDIHLKVQTGRRFYFGKTFFFNTTLASSLLHRYQLFKPHAVYRQQDWLQLQQDLAQSGYFNQVLIEPKFSKGKRVVPLRVQAHERKRLRYFGGFGFLVNATMSHALTQLETKDFNYRAFLGVKFRRLNRYGHKADFVYLFSNKVNKYDVNYYVPGRKPQSDYYKLGLMRKTEDNVQLGDLDELMRLETLQFFVEYQHKIGGWIRLVSLFVLDEKQRSFSGATVRKKVLYPSIVFSRAWSRQEGGLLDAHLLTRLIVSHKNFGSTLNITKAFVQGDLDYRLNEDYSLYGHGALGILATNDMNQVPADLLLLTGGEMSVRGYRYQSIGPGKYLKVWGLEGHRKLYGKLAMLLFYDAGIVADDWQAAFKTSYGFGVVYQTPIGNIALSLAQPTGTSLWQLQLTVRPG